MASSVGEAIGEGLERGLRIGGGLRDRQRQQRRQDEQDEFERQDREMRAADRQIGLEDRQRRLKREHDEDARRRRTEGLAAVDAQLADVKGRLATVTDPNSALARQLTGQHEALTTQRNRGLVAAGGYDFEAEQREAAADLEVLRSGQGGTLPPARRVRAIASATRRDVGEFRRGADGAPSKIGGAIEDFRAGLGGGDSTRMLRGANVLLAPELQRGVGEASPHGGTIVSKEIVAFDPAPGATPEDPQMIPRLRVWVKGPQPKSDDERRALNRWRAATPGIPEGATGFYFAPVTEDRSSRPDAPVRVIGMARGMQYLDGLRQMEEWVNDPTVAADIDAGLGQWDQRRFLAARGALPVKVQSHNVAAGGTLVTDTTDATGRTTREVFQSPTPKTNPELDTARLGLITAQTAAAAALGGLRERSTGRGAKTSRDEARERLGLLTQERIAIQGSITNLVRELEFASGERRKQIPAELAAARQQEKDLTGRIQALQKDANAPDEGAQAPSAVAAPAPQIAVNPKTGERLQLRDGQWVPMK